MKSEENFSLTPPNIWPAFANKLAAGRARISSNDQNLFVGLVWLPVGFIHCSLFLLFILWAVGRSNLPQRSHQSPAFLLFHVHFCQPSTQFYLSPPPEITFFARPDCCYLTPSVEFLLATGQKCMWQQGRISPWRALLFSILLKRNGSFLVRSSLETLRLTVRMSDQQGKKNWMISCILMRSWDMSAAIYYQMLALIRLPFGGSCS